MLNELLGFDEKKTPKKNIEDNALIKRNTNMKFESKKLMDSISNGLIKRGLGKEVIQEEVIRIPSSNPLIDGSNQLTQSNEELMKGIENILRNRKK